MHRIEVIIVEHVLSMFVLEAPHWKFESDLVTQMIIMHGTTRWHKQ